MKAWMVMLFESEHKVTAGGSMEGNLNLSWANGMIGIVPVFKTKKTATKYIGKGSKADIQEIEI